MKTIEDLTVKVTYKVGIGGLEVSKKVFEQLSEIYNSGCEIDGTNCEDYPEAAEWLRDNIKEGDCCELEYEIEELG